MACIPVEQYIKIKRAMCNFCKHTAKMHINSFKFDINKKNFENLYEISMSF